MTLPSHLNRTQFHELLSKYTGNPNIRHSQFQKALKEAGVHKEVMYGARFGREKATKILSTVKEHLEASHREKGYGVRGRGALFHENLEHVYRQHVRKLAQDDIAMRNEARTDAAQRRTDAANVAQRQKLATQIREQRRATVQSRLQALQSNVLRSPSAQEKKKDETTVPLQKKMLYGEGIAALTDTARPEQENPTFFESAGSKPHNNGPMAPSPTDINPLGEIAEEVAPVPIPKPSEKPKGTKLPDTSAVDRGLPL